MLALALFVCMLDFLVRFFKLGNLCGQLHITTVMLAQRISVEQAALHALPCKGFLWSIALLILTTVPCIMGILHAPMLLS